MPEVPEVSRAENTTILCFLHRQVEAHFTSPPHPKPIRRNAAQPRPECRYRIVSSLFGVSNLADVHCNSNDALRAHGILPPKPPTPPSPSTFLPSQAELLHSALESSSTQRLGEMAEDALDSDDERMFESYRMKKLQELKKAEAAERSVAEGRGLRQIGRDEFVREVSEASAKDIEALGEEGEGRGTGVVCFLYKDS